MPRGFATLNKAAQQPSLGLVVTEPKTVAGGRKHDKPAAPPSTERPDTAPDLSARQHRYSRAQSPDSPEGAAPPKPSTAVGRRPSEPFRSTTKGARRVLSSIVGSSGSTGHDSTPSKTDLMLDMTQMASLIISVDTAANSPEPRKGHPSGGAGLLAANEGGSARGSGEHLLKASTARTSVSASKPGSVASSLRSSGSQASERRRKFPNLFTDLLRSTERLNAAEEDAASKAGSLTTSGGSGSGSSPKRKRTARGATVAEMTAALKKNPLTGEAWELSAQVCQLSSWPSVPLNQQSLQQEAGDIRSIKAAADKPKALLDMEHVLVKRHFADLSVEEKWAAYEQILTIFSERFPMQKQLARKTLSFSKRCDDLLKAARRKRYDQLSAFIDSELEETLVDELRGSVERWKAVSDHYEQRLEREEIERAEQEAIIEEEIADKAREIAELREECMKPLPQLAATKQKIAIMFERQAALMEKKGALDKRQKEYDEITELNTGLGEDVSVLESGASTHLTEARRQRDKLVQHRKAMSLRMLDLNDQVDKMNAELQELDQSHKHLTERRQMLRDDVRTSQTQIEALRKRLRATTYTSEVPLTPRPDWVQLQANTVHGMQLPLRDEDKISTQSLFAVISEKIALTNALATRQHQDIQRLKRSCGIITENSDTIFFNSAPPSFTRAEAMLKTDGMEPGVQPHRKCVLLDVPDEVWSLEETEAFALQLMAGLGEKLVAPITPFMASSTRIFSRNRGKSVTFKADSDGIPGNSPDIGSNKREFGAESSGRRKRGATRGSGDDGSDTESVSSSVDSSGAQQPFEMNLYASLRSVAESIAQPLHLDPTVFLYNLSQQCKVFRNNEGYYIRSGICDVCDGVIEGYTSPLIASSCVTLVEDLLLQLNFHKFEPFGVPIQEVTTLVQELYERARLPIPFATDAVRRIKHTSPQFVLQHHVEHTLTRVLMDHLNVQQRTLLTMIITELALLCVSSLLSGDGVLLVSMRFFVSKLQTITFDPRFIAFLPSNFPASLPDVSGIQRKSCCKIQASLLAKHLTHGLTAEDPDDHFSESAVATPTSSAGSFGNFGASPMSSFRLKRKRSFVRKKEVIPPSGETILKQLYTILKEGTLLTPKDYEGALDLFPAELIAARLAKLKLFSYVVDNPSFSSPT